MTLQELAQALSCEVVVGADRVPTKIERVIASDGMSEILAFSCPGAVMLTGLTNIQSVRTAVVADACAIVYVRGKRPADRVIELAREKSIPVLLTKLGMFESCGLLYRLGLRGAM